MRKLPEISIQNPVFAWMLMASLLLFGGISFDRMGVSQLPDVDFPNVNINVALDGAAPEVMEMDVVDVIEGGLTSISGIKGISSNSRTGTANISVEFDLSKNIDVAVQEVQSALGRVQRRLPIGVEPPSVQKSNPEDQPILWLAVTSEKMSRTQLMALVRDQIQDRFSTVDGVGEVFMGGYLEPNLRIFLNQKKLDQYQLTASDVISAIQREHSERPGGRIETGPKEINIRTLGEAPNLKEFENLSITRRGGAVNFSPIPLKEVADVQFSTIDARSLSRVNGKTAVGLGIRKQSGSNAVSVAKAVRERLKEVQLVLPKDVEIQVRMDSTRFIEEAVHELNFTLLFSAFLTAIVCWLFLGSWSATLNVILAIPTSVVGTFIVLNALGFTLNTFTLLGLSLAIGIVVDDAIMVLENIVRHNQMGKSKLQSAKDGAVEITLAAMATTAAIIAIFLPVAFMDGVIGRYFFQFGVTLSVAVAISLLEALTLTPMRCAQFLSVEPRRSWIGKSIESFFQSSSIAYGKSIQWTIKRPMFTLLSSLLVFVGSLVVGKFIKQEFVPAQDQGMLMVRISTPTGSSLAVTDEKMKEIETILLKRKEVSGYFSSVGGGPGGGQVNNGNIFLALKPNSERELSAQDLANELRKDLKPLKGVRAFIQDPSLSGLGGGRSFPVEFSIRGPDWDRLVVLSKNIVQKLEETKLVTDVDTNVQDGMPEVQILPDRTAARNYGVDVAAISEIVNVMMAGTVVGKYSADGRRSDIRVGLPVESRSTVDDIRSLKVRNSSGELISLTKLVRIEEKNGLQAITREDRMRSIRIRANVARSSSQAEALKVAEKIIQETLPEGYSGVASGSAKTFRESFSGLIFAMLLGILVSYMVLASQFNSFIHPVTILVALPFSVSGAFLGLFLGGATLNVFSMIGMILLMGIVKKNSIMLVEFANQLREQGSSAQDSMLKAGPIRLRPILMTTAATIAGAIPPALAIGPGAETRIPMALAVLGGVILSTLLTLFVVPAMYVLLARFERKHVT